MPKMLYDIFMDWIHRDIVKLNWEQFSTCPGKLKHCTQLKQLYCNGKHLTYLPFELGRCTQLQLFDCSNNRLTYLPGEIGFCTRLHYLNCEFNMLRTLPMELCFCTELIHLICHTNRLTSLPVEIGLCTQLLKLNCSYNQLTSLPVEIGLCTQLIHLICSGNKLTYLPVELGLCTQLTRLYCDFNLLTYLPTELGLCTQLQYLYCDNNQITSLPTELGLCTQLQYLCCSSNPIEYIPPNILGLLNRNRYRQHLYTDTQSVHNHSIQQGIRNGIMYLLTKKPTITFDELTQQILTEPILSEQSKRLLMEYMGNEEVHSIFNITFKELLLNVISHVNTFDTTMQHNFFEILNTEITDSECKCFTGRLSRLVNSLNGLDEHIQVHISENEQIGNIIIVCKNRMNNSEYNVELHKEMVRSELLLRNVNIDTIEKWLEYITE